VIQVTQWRLKGWILLEPKVGLGVELKTSDREVGSESCLEVVVSLSENTRNVHVLVRQGELSDLNVVLMAI